ncbi:DinB family protein [Streptomonospora litoralis]|uniref:DinB superfamily protein n=1 Tax=Streptomonospora litoralis TaxID=2498135 RepID=A0A4P6Q2H2_9ACTN|nr:DinB family protein [Streptomonospora litoralis]QBI54350.1 DinB superfamily protein [Streptomonospora litoralis]
MTTAPASEHRRAPETERGALIAELATVRAALITTPRGLSDAQAAERPTVSALCPGGLIKHVASMEQGWMRFAVEGTAAMKYDLPEGVTWADIEAGTAREIPQWMIDHENGFRVLPGEGLAGIIAGYEDVAARTEEIIASVPDLSATYAAPEAPWEEGGSRLSVRGVILHVISETAQHAGHADILREAIDGRTAT